MKASEILKTLREKRGLTQEQLAARVLVTRQAVSRWETGETQPSTETLKLLSRELDASINTLLGAPRQLICQCCGMPLAEDALLSREPDGSFNEDYTEKDTLLDYLIAHMPNPENTPEEARRAQYDAYLSQLRHWKPV